jgi:hypothetical protein
LNSTHGKTTGLTVSLEWDRETGSTQVVVHDSRTAIEVVLGVPGAKAADAFQHQRLL